MNRFIDQRKNELGDIISTFILNRKAVPAQDFSFEVFYDCVFIENRAIAEFLLKTITWENTLIEMANCLRTDIPSFEDRKIISKTFSEVADELRDFLNCKLEEVDELIRNEFGCETFLRYILMGYSQELYAIERGYAMRGYFSELLTILKAGRLPCGWDGDFPNGRLLFH